MKSVFAKLALFALLLATQHVYAQKTVVSGRVIDAASGDPIPFANVIFVNQSTGTTTDFDGHYKMESAYESIL